MSWGDQEAQKETPAASPAGFWIWHDTYLILGALAFTADRAASFLALEDQLAALHSWTGEQDRVNGI